MQKYKNNALGRFPCGKRPNFFTCSMESMSGYILLFNFLENSFVFKYQTPNRNKVIY